MFHTWNSKFIMEIRNAKIKNVTVDDGDTLVINSNPEKTNYMFKGWYTDSDCTVPYDFARPVTTSFNLYACFALKTKIINCEDCYIKIFVLIFFCLIVYYIVV